MKKQAYIKRVVKNVKYTANGKEEEVQIHLNLCDSELIRDTSQQNVVTLLDFHKITPRFGRRLNFSEWAMSLGRAQGGGGQGASKGAGGESKVVDVWRWFPGDFQDPVWYYEGENDENSPNLDRRNLTEELFKI